jgi:hypothetical protein
MHPAQPEFVEVKLVKLLKPGTSDSPEQIFRISRLIQFPVTLFFPNFIIFALSREMVP